MDNKNIIDVNIEESVKKSYLDYAMSVIVGRALPDIRDGFKPVHRRVLFAMHEMGLAYNKPYRKSARLVGDVIGKYHPHGDSAVYETIVRMAQEFSLRYPLVDGQGNFGSIDGDSAAAMRYTEIRMSKIASEMLSDIDKDTVDFVPTYDDSLMEPVVLPSKIPSLIINGTDGIAVGMATKIPPHNLSEIIDAMLFMIDNDYIEEDILEIVKGPDFPTSAILLDNGSIREAYKTGRGIIKIRAKAHFEENENKKNQIVVTEIPYQVNKATLITRIAELVTAKTIVGISDLRDESDKDGVRVVVDVKRGENKDVLLNQLYSYTQMEVSFGINMVALVDGRPKTVTLVEILYEFLNHRIVVVTRRTEYLLNQAEAKLHILKGLKIALQNIDEVVRLIKEAKDSADARLKLIARFSFSEIQAKAILDMKLSRLTGLEIEKLNKDYDETSHNISEYKLILSSKTELMKVIKGELLEIKDNYGDSRKTEIITDYSNIDIKDLIPNDETIVTMTHNGYIKRTLLNNFTSQRRGGKGKNAVSYKEGDFVDRIIATRNHEDLLFFTNKGKIYFLRVYALPELSREARGRHISNFLTMEKDEYVRSVLAITGNETDAYIFIATKKGVVRKTLVDNFKSGRSGMVAINLREGDEFVEALLLYDNDMIFLATRKGKSIKFEASDVRAMGRKSYGVKGIDTDEKDEIVSVEKVTDEPRIVVVTKKGYGKSTLSRSYRLQKRGGKGVKISRINKKTGYICGAKQVQTSDNIMIITKYGKMIRLSLDEVPILGRDTQGVRLMNLDDDEIIAFAVIGDE